MELVEQLMLLKRLSSYGLVGEIIIAVGLLIIFIYQQRKIGSLETQIKSQTGILENAEHFIRLFDLDKLEGYADIREEKVRIEKEIEIKQIKTDLDETIKTQEAMKRGIGSLLEQYDVALDAFLDAFFKLPSVYKREVISRMGEGVLKRKMEETNKKLEEAENSTRVNALTLALKIGRKEKEGVT